MAEPTLSKHVKMSSVYGPIHPGSVKALRSAAAPSIKPTQKSKRRRRSRMSAAAPAGNPSSNTGRLATVCISTMSKGDVVSAVISHVPAVSCIQLPVLEMMDASK